MRNDFIRAGLKKVPFMLHSTTMDSLLEMANSETPRAENPELKIANNSITYQTIGDIAIIGVDGAMYKKDIGGMCSSVVAYPAILQAIDKAEADDSIKTTLFRVDTPGGAVFGADEVEERIFNSKNKTITFFENMGASAGIYIFMASDEVYASETTMLGSIGVVVSYMEEDEETKKRRVDIVSKNAQNKKCSLNGNCKDEILSMINTHEAIFYDRVMKNTGFSEEKIKSTFNDGGMIFAKEAQNAGFIKEVISFSKLMKSINNSGSTFVPTASSDDTMKFNTGAYMEFSQANFDILLESRGHLNENIKTLNAKIEENGTALEAKDSDIAKLIAEHETKLSEAVANLVSFKTETTTRMEEAINEGVDLKVALAMVNADSKETSSKLALDSKQSNGKTQTMSLEQPKSAWEDQSFKRGSK